ncbi:hypothetical protein OTK51_04435 [Vibrio scophthalmi]|uniref:hypothetical protein n=1 Tax=Vibrio scophthalmi TaxID=45658 RepID=UPI002284A220|nr:hypothetical protein [Vibrio scophthalmi]MCY9802675.1 hypothetical protein [Vibrio scophthalmi]
MSSNEVRRAVSYLLLEGDAWPPSLPEFIALGRQELVDFDEAFDRMIRGKPKSDIEYWATQEVGYLCRSYLNERDARSKYRKVLKKYADKYRAGSLPARNQKRLQDKSNIKPICDIQRPMPEQFDKSSVFARVAAMGARV